MIEDPTCENCTYEVDADNINEETGYCEACQEAYSHGFEVGIRDIAFDDAWRRNQL